MKFECIFIPFARNQIKNAWWTGKRDKQIKKELRIQKSWTDEDWLATEPVVWEWIQ